MNILSGPILLVASLTADPGIASPVPYFHGDIYHEIISTAILLLPLIQEGLLSATSKSMLTKYLLSS